MLKSKIIYFFAAVLLITAGGFFYAGSIKNPEYVEIKTLRIGLVPDLGGDETFNKYKDIFEVIIMLKIRL